MRGQKKRLLYNCGMIRSVSLYCWHPSVSSREVTIHSSCFPFDKPHSEANYCFIRLITSLRELTALETRRTLFCKQYCAVSYVLAGFKYKPLCVYTRSTINSIHHMT